MSKAIKNNSVVIADNIQNRIYTVRGVQVMLDHDLATLYEVKTKVLNQAVKRNVDRFPEQFMFQLSKKEYKFIRSQFVTLKIGQGQHRKYLPCVFTEQGVSMLSAVLKSDVAIEVSIKIIDSFVQMRHFLSQNAEIFTRLKRLEKYKEVSSKQLEIVLKALEDKTIKPKQGIFYDGQVFDAYSLLTDIVRISKKSIILIDNYVDDSVLQLFTKRNKGVAVTIYTKNISKTLKQDLIKFNKQYDTIEIKKFDKAHDRFLIIDEKEVYHFGASLKDLGKKWFAL